LNAQHRRLASLFGVFLSLTLLAAPLAEARRGGSFGSRGSRTFMAPSPTYTSPGYVSPVQRSMTRPTSPSYGYPPTGYRRPGLFGGFGGGFLGGMLAGGLLGGLFGHGWGWGGGWGGWGGGLFFSIIQIIILVFVIRFIIRLFRGGMGGGGMSGGFVGAPPGYSAQPMGYAAQPGGFAPSPAAQPIQFAITPADQAAFEQLLIQVQDAFSHEDFGRLRGITTPEVMGYLAEELSQNATHGVRNEVTGTRLLQADVSESWSEGPQDYATIAMRYESIDIMRRRDTGQVVQGDPTRPTQTTEVWTFVRENRGPWLLSAIQT
jgi:predicted lipid-binding transport protein (Tim44 family)